MKEDYIPHVLNNNINEQKTYFTVNFQTVRVLVHVRISLLLDFGYTPKSYIDLDGVFFFFRTLKPQSVIGHKSPSDHFPLVQLNNNIFF